MNESMIQLLVLAGIAVFLILRLRAVLGSREGFEKPVIEEKPAPARRGFDTLEAGVDHDILDHAPDGSEAARALAAMKAADPAFNVGKFLQGARSAYEMILMAYETGDLDKVRPFLGAEVRAAFEAAQAQRTAQGLRFEGEFLGVREVSVAEARFDPAAKEAEITVRFTGELKSVLRGPDGTVVEGDPKAAHRQRDLWTFARDMDSADPNWQLVATGA